MNRRRTRLLGLAAALAVATFWCSLDAPGPAPTAVAPAAAARPERPRPELVTSPDPGRSPLADRLNAADASIGDDLRIVRAVLDNHLVAFGAPPFGSNREITAQLAGRNVRRHAPLPPDHPSIDHRGELVDRWGTPFFFHALGDRRMEIRSAGPDHELFTADDAVSAPAPGRGPGDPRGYSRTNYGEVPNPPY